MTKAQEKDTPQEVATPSMEEILQSIRGVISGDAEEDSDVLELTEIIEDPNAPAIKEPEAAPEDSHNTSILDDIDAALGNNDANNIVSKEEPLATENIASPAQIEEKPKEAEASPIIPQETNIPEIAVAEAQEVIANDTKIDALDFAFNNDIKTEPDADVAENTSAKASSSSRLLDDRATQLSSVPLKELVNSVHDKHIDSPHTRGGTSLEDLVIEAMKPFLAEWLNKNLPVIVRKIVEKEVKRLIPKEEVDY